MLDKNACDPTLSILKKINPLANSLKKSSPYPPFVKGGEGGFIRPVDISSQ